MFYCNYDIMLITALIRLLIWNLIFLKKLALKFYIRYGCIHGFLQLYDNSLIYNLTLSQLSALNNTCVCCSTSILRTYVTEVQQCFHVKVICDSIFKSDNFPSKDLLLGSMFIVSAASCLKFIVLVRSFIFVSNQCFMIQNFFIPKL